MLRIITVILLTITLISCGEKKDVSVSKPGSGGQINGAGATFPYPIYSKWFNEYAKINKDAKINYQSIGSGGGVKQITEGTVDFGASDSPMSNEEIEKAIAKYLEPDLHFTYNRKAVLERTKRGKLKQFQSMI